MSTRGVKFLDPEQLFDAIRKIHDAVVGLAAKYQPIHDGVKKEKESCSILHRYISIFHITTEYY